MSEDVLDRAERVLEGVSPEPWVAVVKSYSGEGGDYDAAYIPGVVEEETGGYDVEPYAPLTVEDARFIAASRTLVPELSGALRDEREQVAELRAQLSALAAELERVKAGSGN